MGIRGLETFVSDYFKKNPHAVNMKKLGELKMVIDGNQLPYMIQINDRELNEGLYGGNYDQLYQRLLVILGKLKESIECIVFDGSKELPSKASERLKKKIFEVANLTATDQQHAQRSDSDKSPEEKHKETLLRLPPFMMKNLLIDVCNELEIEHYMADGFADHMIAVHANQGPGTFTVFSGDSCFYVYDLKGGYVPNKGQIVEDLFRHPERITSETLVPVFTLEAFKRHLGIKNHLTWIYFCMLLGDYDLGLMRNSRYLNSIGVDPRIDLMRLAQYLSKNETNLFNSNFGALRKTYQQNLLKTIDEQLEIYQFKRNECGKVAPINGLISDFDRFVETIKKIEANFAWCCVEDCREESVLAICKRNHLLSYVYQRIFAAAKDARRKVQVEEYLRVKSPTPTKFMKVEKIPAGQDGQVKEVDCLVKHLERKNRQAATCQDDTSLLLAALALWSKWLEENKYQVDVKSAYSSQSFVDAVLLNYAVISVKNCVNEEQESQDDATEQPPAANVSPHQLYQRRIKQIVAKNLEQMKKLAQIYDEIIGNVELVDFKVYLAQDLRIVHRHNEFKSVYYILGVINKLNSYAKLDFLPPNLFFNGFFQFARLQSGSSGVSPPVNGAPATAKAKELAQLADETSELKKLIEELREQVDSTKRDLEPKKEEEEDVASALDKLVIR